MNLHTLLVSKSVVYGNPQVGYDIFSRYHRFLAVHELEQCMARGYLVRGTVRP